MRCILIGDKGCGKTSLALTFLLGKCPALLPESFNSYTKYYAGTLVEVQVKCPVDINNTTLCSRYFKEIDAILFCFAVDDPSTFDSIQQYWSAAVRDYAYDYDIQLFLVGCKSDTLPRFELTPSALLRSPSALVIRTPTMTSLKNMMLTRTPTLNLQSPSPTEDVTTGADSGIETCDVDMRTDTRASARPDTPYPRGEKLITRELGQNLANQLGCVEYVECTVREDGARSVENLFTKVVNKTRKRKKAGSVVQSSVCVIL